MQEKKVTCLEKDGKRRYKSVELKVKTWIAADVITTSGIVETGDDITNWNDAWKQ